MPVLRRIVFLLLSVSLILVGCSSPNFRHTSYDYHYYYSRSHGYRYSPGTAHSYSYDPCNTLAEARVQGNLLYLTVVDGPWVAFPVLKKAQPFSFTMMTQGMFMHIRTSQGTSVWTQKNGDTWEQRHVGACILLKE